MKDLTLIVENVRTFRGRHEIPIRPLTILTGENSSGKTTLLAMLSAASSLLYPLKPNFNSDPYSLGNYDTIASNDPVRELKAPHFSVGFRRPQTNSERIRDAEAKYVDDHGQLRLSDFRLRGEDIELSIAVSQASKDSLNGAAIIRALGITTELPFSGLQTGPLINLLSELLRELNVELNGSDVSATIFQALVDVCSGFLNSMPKVISLAPIRTEPHRVYSQVAEAFEPTGYHIPFVFEHLMQGENGAPEREYLVSLVRRFGLDSGLFSEVTVSRFGSKPNAPFELRVGLGGATINLVDVGYGVSQVLPVLVELSTAPHGEFLLLQQPEIHLHPRAQAALGSLFADLSASGHLSIIVETHSDHLIDRVRQEVAAGKISPDRVALHYLHRNGLETTCHLIELDSLGNLINPPDHYRSFFLEEERRLLLRGSRS